MRVKTGFIPALGLLLALGMTGCGGKGSEDPGIASAGNGKASASASANKLSDAEAAAKFGQCMRDNGFPDFEDPKVEDGGFQIKFDGKGGESDKAKVDAAMAKCKQYMPGGGEPPKMDAKQVEQQRKHSQCMRDNGLPNYPDPEPNGGIQINMNDLGIAGPDDPKLKAAEEACKDQQPKPPSGAAGEPKTDSRSDG